MDAQRWARIESLYHAALAKEPGERPEYLAAACAQEPGLRREVESLLGCADAPLVSLLEDGERWAAGFRLGSYEILGPLGAGGMGEVYRAKDTRLRREVAIKVLPRAFQSDPARLARFEREAQVLASLNHPHIGAIYGLEESQGIRFLVLELVEGPTLAERIAQGPVPEEEALAIAAQIVEAMECAHERNVIHRDLKPANIKLAPDGSVKVLDFGLAKALSDPVPTSNPADSPTFTATAAGVILGTAAYMSPEQARGKVVDKRADIWAFGCVLYEMLVGKPPFRGESVTDVLAAVVKAEPDLGPVPAKIRRLLRRCLEKDPRKRLRDIGDVWELVEDGAEATTPSRSWLSIGVFAVLAVALAGVSWIAWREARPVNHPLTRLSVDLGPEAMTGFNTTVAISPDGRRIVYPVKTGLATRLLDQAAPTLLPGTEGGFDAFFSPDSQWIGFFAGGQLKKISVQGGASVALCSASSLRGSSWGEDGNIVAALNGPGPLSLVSAAGGAPKRLTRLAAGEITHRWPQVLPGAQAVLFTASLSITGQENANIEAVSLKTGRVTVLIRGGYYGRYLPSGHLVYIHQGVLFGVGFDPVRLEVHGGPTPLLEDLAANPVNGGGQFDFSAAGTLVYLAGKGSAQTWQVAWLDSSGKTQPLISAPGVYALPRFSPDGKKLGFSNGSDISFYDLERGTTTRLTFTGNSGGLVWTPDGRHIACRGGGFGLFWISSDGAGEPQRLLESQNLVVPWSFSPDGRRLAYYELDAETGLDLWTLPLDLTDPDRPKPGKPELFLRTPAIEQLPRFSPDGRWIAYRSNESGNNEIYVRPFPAGSGGKWQISSGGALYALWSNDGRELFYENADHRIMVVDYTVGGASFAPGKPRVWSDKQLFYSGFYNLDLAPDGKRFAVLTAPEAAGSEKGSVHVTLLQNFFDEVKRRIPAGGK